jgi:hypothetical protein
MAEVLGLDIKVNPELDFGILVLDIAGSSCDVPALVVVKGEIIFSDSEAIRMQEAA